MSIIEIEHVNITAPDPLKTAHMLEKVFGWKIRWQGPSKNNGFTVHVGSEDSYIAIYSVGRQEASTEASYHTIGGLNHIGVVVDDLDAVEARVIEAGFTPNNHGDYEPGRRFYFDDHDGIEFEVASYA